MKLKKMLTALAALFVVSSAPAAAKVAAPVAGCDSTAVAPAPRYIFYFIGDGMGIAHVRNADIFNNKVLGADSTLRMLTLPVTSLCTTFSASSDVTDSAAAGTALATGRKTRNGMLGVTPDSVAATSMAKVLFDKGWGVGLITTVAIDDATPGAFYAHVPARGEYYTIGRQLAESGYQFAAGAALRAARDKEGRSTGLVEYFAKQGVKVAYGPEGLQEEADRLLVLGTDSVRTWNVGYTVDSVPGALTLPAMTEAGIRQLMRVSPDRFFMMVEGGNIDHAGHANDGGTIVREVINFDQAIAIAYQFYLAHPDETLIVITADHETGGMSVGNTYTAYAVDPRVASAQKVSKELFTDHIKSMALDRRIYRWPDMEEYLRENLGLGSVFTLTDDETKELSRMFETMMEGRNSAPDQETLYATFDGFTARVFEIFNRNAGFGFTSIKHTGSPVPVFAVGVGADRFSPLNDNVDIPRKLLRIALGKPAGCANCH